MVDGRRSDPQTLRCGLATLIYCWETFEQYIFLSFDLIWLRQSKRGYEV